MSNKLAGKRVAVVLTDGFEEVEMTSPREALEAEGAQITLIAPSTGKVQAWRHDVERGEEFEVDVSIDQAEAEQYDALLLPGGVRNPDKLRTNLAVQRFVQAFADSGRLIAAICHGPWTLIDAGVARGRRLTSYPSLRTDLRNAGCEWVDEQVVVDRGLITSRNPDDLPAFNEQIIAALHRDRGA